MVTNTAMFCSPLEAWYTFTSIPSFLASPDSSESKDSASRSWKDASRYMPKSPRMTFWLTASMLPPPGEHEPGERGDYAFPVLAHHGYPDALPAHTARRRGGRHY